MRSKVSEAFKYWMIPADANQRLDRFMAFYQGLHNPQKLQQLATQAANASKAAQKSDLKQRQAVAAFMVQLGQQFASGGYEKIATTIEKTVDEPRRQEVTELYAAALQQLLKNLYLDVLQQEGIKADTELSAFDSQFYTDAVEAANLGYLYGSPWFFELERFQHIEATGLQITRSPGQWLVFPGCLLLVLGVFCMFYLPQRRLWLLVETKDQGVSILLAGNAVRNRYDFDREFAGIAQQLNPTV
jgi:cytochrome c biogenesis protein